MRLYGYQPLHFTWQPWQRTAQWHRRRYLSFLPGPAFLADSSFHFWTALRPVVGGPEPVDLEHDRLLAWGGWRTRFRSCWSARSRTASCRCIWTRAARAESPSRCSSCPPKSALVSAIRSVRVTGRLLAADLAEGLDGQQPDAQQVRVLVLGRRRQDRGGLGERLLLDQRGRTAGGPRSRSPGACRPTWPAACGGPGRCRPRPGRPARLGWRAAGPAPWVARGDPVGRSSARCRRPPRPRTGLPPARPARPSPAPSDVVTRSKTPRPRADTLVMAAFGSVAAASSSSPLVRTMSANSFRDPASGLPVSFSHSANSGRSCFCLPAASAR